MTEVRVYFRNGAGFEDPEWVNKPHSAFIGPLRAHSVDDVVTVPGRGPKCGDHGAIEQRCKVARVFEDGVALAVPLP